jgi:AraC-like DNA-binding protein
MPSGFICPPNRYGNGEEKVAYDSPAFPFYLRRSDLSRFAEHRALPHYHLDFEYIFVYSGVMAYDVDGEKAILHQGEGIFVNSKSIHFGYGVGNQDCDFLCLLFSPLLLGSTQNLIDRFLTPYLDSATTFILLPQGSKALQTLQDLYREKMTGQPSELTYESLLFRLWQETLPFFPASAKKKLSPDLASLKSMMAFIRSEYSQDLSLKNIADAVYLSPSTASRLFRHYLHQSPIAYLIAYRLEESVKLLLQTHEEVSQIAFDCGYSSPSFFIRSFKEKYGMTPACYRRNKKKETSEAD